MNRLSILLLTGLLCLITNFGIAQGPTFSITPQSQSVTAGSTVSFTVNVTNFTNIEGFQYSMNWNPAELTYVSVSDFTLPGLTQGLFALNGNSKLGVSWTTPTGGAVSFANGLFYKVNFTAVKSGTASMLFGNMPVPPEITGANGSDLTGQSVFSPVLGTSGGGGGGTTTCAAPSVINVTPSTTSASASWAAVTGANSYNVQYKTAAATVWTTATSTVPSFTVPALVTCTDYEVKVQTVCTSGSSAYSSSTGFKTTGCGTTGGGTGGNGPCWTCNTANTLNGFGLIFSEEYTDVVGADVNVKLHVNQFTKMEGMQFEIRWDPTQLEYKGVNPTLAGLTLGSFNTVNVTTGKLSMGWSDPNAIGATLTDCTSILDLQFKTLGAAGSTATVYINNTATAIIPFEITALVNGVSQQLNVPTGNLIAGKVILKKCAGTTPTPTSCVPPSYTKTFNLAQTTVKSLDQTCVDVFVNDFTAIEGFQASIKWDPSVLNFITAKKTGLTDLAPGQYNVDPTNGTMTISYNPTATSNVTLPNGASIFQICFTAAGNNGISTDVKFATAPLNFEVYAAGISKPGVTTQNGKVLIAEPPTVTIKELSPSCSGAQTGSMTAEVPAGGTYSYAWSQGSNAAIIGTTATISNLAVASYRVTVTDAKSCLTNTAVANLSNKAAPKITKIATNTAGTGLIVEATFAKTYQWANAAGVIVGTDKELINIPTGKYFVTVTGDFLCTAEGSGVFIKVNVLTQNAKCGQDGKITLDAGAGNFTYTWSPNTSNTNVASNLSTGSYKVTVTETALNGSTTLDIPMNGPQILVLAPITVDAGPVGCATAGATGGTGTYSYQWNNGNNVASAKNCGLSALSKYYVTITDQNGCSVTNFGKIPDAAVTPICPALTLADNNITVKHTTCGLKNGEINIKPVGGSGDFMVAWSPVGGSITISNLEGGTYNVTVSDKQCPAQIKKNDIKVDASTSPVVELDVAVDAKDNCTGSITLKIKDGTLPFTYAWTPNANGQTVKDPISLCEGLYKVTVTDAKGCVASVSSDIKVTGTSVPLVDDATTVTKTKCPNSTDGAIDFVVKGGKAPFTYVWKLNGTVYPGTGSSLTNLAVGTYQVTATDASGKTVTKDFALTSASLLDYTLKVSDPKPNSAKNGSASVQINNGIAPYVYLWSNGEKTPQINNLSTGTYTITITDGNGCAIIKTFPIGDVGSVEIITRTNFNGVNIRCFGMCNGIAEVKNVPDAVAPLQYKWSTGDTSRIVKGLCVGTHKVIVTDALKQNFEGAINITGPDKLDLVLKTTDATNGLDGKAEINTLGGTAPFSYRWNNDGLSSIITNQVPGRVFVMVTDANGCDAFKEGVIGPRGTDVACMTAIPIITPNGDGYNDMFDIYCLDDYPKNKLDVFNRYGQLVFTKENYINRSWMPIDAKGNQLPEGGYFYVIETVHTDGSRPKTKGYFTILND